MKKQSKMLVCALAATLAIAFVPTTAFAGTAKDKVQVSFTSGIPGEYDVVGKIIEAKGDLAETYFPEIKDNEPDGVSFADVLVQAHINKYGKAKVKDYLTITNGDYGTKIVKQFGRTDVGLYYVNGTALQANVSEAVKTGSYLYAGSFKNSAFTDLYGSLEKGCYEATAGKKVTVKVFADNRGTKVVPTAVTINTVDGRGKVKALKTAYKNGTATFTVDQAGTCFIAPTGIVKYKGESGSEVKGEIMSNVSCLEIKAPSVPKVKGVRLTLQKGKKIRVDWKKASGAAGYRIGFKVKGSKKFAYKNVSKTKKTCTVKGLKVGKQYVFCVQAYKKAGKEMYFGKETKKTSGKVIA